MGTATLTGNRIFVGSGLPSPQNCDFLPSMLVPVLQFHEVDTVAAWESRRGLTLERIQPLRDRAVRDAGSLGLASPKMGTVGHLSSRSRIEGRDN